MRKSIENQDELDELLSSPQKEEPSTKKLKKQHQDLDQSLDDMLDEDLDTLVESDKENQDANSVSDSPSPPSSKVESPRRARSRIVIDDE